MQPLKELFGAIFFVSMGALMDIRLVPLFLLPITFLVATSLIAKFASTYLAARGQGIPRAEAKRTAITMSASGGELALVIAKGGADVGATSPFVLPIIGAMTIVTTFLSPYLVRLGWANLQTDRPAPTRSPEA
jgi:monovalent cation:H+ antiporter-2, CPA2 family